MFVQVFTGKVTDAKAVRDVFESWQTGAGQGAVGWLGSTAGVTDDGQLIGIARFTSQDAARANSERPEQGEWWASLAANLDGDATFFESGDVHEDLAGDPDTAGFVQVMRGQLSAGAHAQELLRVDPGVLAASRPDILGSLLIGDEGEYVMAVYFTSEAEAREGEKKELPAEVAAEMEKMSSLMVGPTTYFDLRGPWLVSAA